LLSFFLPLYFFIYFFNPYSLALLNKHPYLLALSTRTSSREPSRPHATPRAAAARHPL
jgi:hypothetical protein